MSNRRGGPGSRNSKANKAKQQKGGSGSSTLPNGQLPQDDLHNWDLPCCSLLQEVTQDLWTFQDCDGENTSSTQEEERRTPSLFVHMMRNHLLEQQQQRRKADSAASTTPSKKKKKKKKKKANNKAAGGASNPAAGKDDASKAGQETDETDSIAAISSTVSQDSQPVSTSVSREEPKSTTGAATPAAQTPAKATTTTTTPRRTPVDTYLDRLSSEAAEKKKEGAVKDQTLMNAPPPSGRGLEAFVQYLNEKHGSSVNPVNNTKTGSTSDPEKTGTNTSTATGLCITKQELETACQSIRCPSCRAAAINALHQDFSMQPLVLPAITFGDSRRGDSNRTNNHNGLAVPIHNQKPGTAACPNVDFDYVALEEGTNPMGTLMEAKADLDGIPYFHPQVVSTTSKKQTKGCKGEDHPTQLEWRFVSSSSSSSSPPPPSSTKTAVSSANPQLTAIKDDTASSSPAITVKDLEHLARNLMLPLGVPPDDLIGACSDLSSREMKEVYSGAVQLARDTRSNLDQAKAEGEGYIEKFNALAGNEEENTDVASPPKLIDLENAVQELLHEVAVDIVLDRLLLLRPRETQDGKKRQNVIRTSPTWHSAVAYLMDSCTYVIVETIESLSDYERCLAGIANSQGKVPEMFTSLIHRTCFRAMLQARIRRIVALIETVRGVSEALEDAWTITASVGNNDASTREGVPNTPVMLGVSGVSISFCVKWYAEQEFCRKLQERRIRREAAASPKERKSTEAEEDVALAHKSAAWNRKQVQTIDLRGEDLLFALLHLAKRVQKGRIDEINEEHSLRCQKLLNMLASVGQDIFAPLLDTNKFSLKDDKLRMQCQSLWTQIQEQKNQQERQQFLNEEGPTIAEQKKTVATMTRASIFLLRRLRKCVTDSYEPSTTPPFLPLKLVSSLAQSQGGARGYDYHSPDAADCSYASLMAGSFAARQPCMGGYGQRRFSSLILALFYRKLSETCSEWHAELAEQELLTTMGGDGIGLDEEHGCVGSVNLDNNSGSKKDVSGSRNGVSNNAGSVQQSGKSGKKSKKKRDKKTAPAIESTDEPNKESTQQSDQELSKNWHQESNGTSNKERKPKGKNATATAKDAVGHTATPRSRKENDNNADATSDGSGSGAVAIQALEECANAAVTETAARHEEELSTYHVDKNIGVADKSGTFQTAEGYLVGRLTALLSAAKHPQTARRDNPEGSSSVVII